MISGSDRTEIWISRFDSDEIFARADAIDTAAESGIDLPLAGLTFAVKDNIDVAGLDTTAGCPAFAYRPETDAQSVRALIEAGALCVGKNNLDQFATGLVGTRSPYGAVRNAIDPRFISGGSSSGSAVAVALGLVDFALNTDTAGSGRIPAAFNGIVGFKATPGLVSTAGVVPACRSFDCVGVFARNVATAERVMVELTKVNGVSGYRRVFPPDSPLGLPQSPVIARAATSKLQDLAPSRLAAYAAALTHLETMGCQMMEYDIEPLLEAGRLLYEGAFLAERYAAVGSWIAAHPNDVDPTVRKIILDGADISADHLAADIGRLADLRAQVEIEWRRLGAHSLILPTSPSHPTLAEVQADPIDLNKRLGAFTTFLNLLDMCGVAVPFGSCDGMPFGVSCIGPAFSDLLQADIARILEGNVDGSDSGLGESWNSVGAGRLAPPGIALAVVGAHLSGQPLNHQLMDHGARLLGTTSTSNSYRLFVLDTVPPKPGLLRVGIGGEHIAVEVWKLPPATFAHFVANVPAPMTIGPVNLEDGRTVSGFLCEPIAVEGAVDITEYGGWLAYLASNQTNH
jgi:allophanate hydrolase